MKFRATPIIYRAVCEGIVAGMQQARQAGEGLGGEQLIQLTADAVMQKLHEVLVFDEEAENLLHLQQIAEGMVVKPEPEPVQPTPQV